MMKLATSVWNVMCDHFFWSGKAVQIKEHVNKCCQSIMFKAKPQRAMKVLWQPILWSYSKLTTYAMN